MYEIPAFIKLSKAIRKEWSWTIITQIPKPSGCQVLKGQIPNIKCAIQFSVWMKMQLSSKTKGLQHFFFKEESHRIVLSLIQKHRKSNSRKKKSMLSVGI